MPLIAKPFDDLPVSVPFQDVDELLMKQDRVGDAEKFKRTTLAQLVAHVASQTSVTKHDWDLTKTPGPAVLTALDVSALVTPGQAGTPVFDGPNNISLPGTSAVLASAKLGDITLSPTGKYWAVFKLPQIDPGTWIGVATNSYQGLAVFAYGATGLGTVNVGNGQVTPFDANYQPNQPILMLLDKATDELIVTTPGATYTTTLPFAADLFAIIINHLVPGAIDSAGYLSSDVTQLGSLTVPAGYSPVTSMADAALPATAKVGDLLVAQADGSYNSVAYAAGDRAIVLATTPAAVAYIGSDVPSFLINTIITAKVPTDFANVKAAVDFYAKKVTSSSGFVKVLIEDNYVITDADYTVIDGDYRWLTIGTVNPDTIIDVTTDFFVVVRSGALGNMYGRYRWAGVQDTTMRQVLQVSRNAHVSGYYVMTPNGMAGLEAIDYQYGGLYLAARSSPDIGYVTDTVTPAYHLTDPDAVLNGSIIYNFRPTLVGMYETNRSVDIYGDAMVTASYHDIDVTRTILIYTAGEDVHANVRVTGKFKLALGSLGQGYSGDIYANVYSAYPAPNSARTIMTAPILLNDQNNDYTLNFPNWGGGIVYEPTVPTSYLVSAQSHYELKISGYLKVRNYAPDYVFGVGVGGIIDATGLEFVEDYDHPDGAGTFIIEPTGGWVYHLAKTQYISTMIPTPDGAVVRTKATLEPSYIPYGYLGPLKDISFADATAVVETDELKPAIGKLQRQITDNDNDIIALNDGLDATNQALAAMAGSMKFTMKNTFVAADVKSGDFYALGDTGTLAIDMVPSGTIFWVRSEAGPLTLINGSTGQVYGGGNAGFDMMMVIVGLLKWDVICLPNNRWALGGSHDLNTFIHGVWTYRCGNDVVNAPAAIEGTLEVRGKTNLNSMVNSPGEIVATQRYTTTDGSIYTRTMTYNTWSAWQLVASAAVLADFEARIAAMETP